MEIKCRLDCVLQYIEIKCWSFPDTNLGWFGFFIHVYFGVNVKPKQMQLCIHLFLYLIHILVGRSPLPLLLLLIPVTKIRAT